MPSRDKRKDSAPVQAFPHSFLQRLKYAPFPYDGEHPETGDDFFDYQDPDTGERCHTTRTGERVGETGHYRDSTVLFFLPPAFDPAKPFYYLVFFHGLRTTMEQSVADHELIAQVAASGRNVILIAPQLAVEAADSSPGKFFQEGVFGLFMKEAGQALAARIGRQYATRLGRAPIVLSAFSGGYKSAAYVLDRGGVAQRIRGLLLLDALYADLDKFESWLRQRIGHAFFLLLYTAGAVEEKAQALAQFLEQEGIDFDRAWPSRIRRGGVFLVKSVENHFLVPLLGPPERPLQRALEALWF